MFNLRRRDPQLLDYFVDAPAQDLKVRAVRGGGASITAQGVKLVTGLITLAIMARLLTPADYGVFALLLIVASFAWVFADLGLAAATIQRKSLTHAQASALFWINLGAGVALALLVSLSAPALAWAFDQPKLKLALPAMAAIFIFAGAAAQHTALLSRSLHFAAVSAADAASLIFGSLMGVGAALAGWGYWSLVIMQIGIAALQMIIVMIMSRWSPSPPGRPFFPRELVRFGGNITGFNFLNYFTRNGDNILIGAVYGSVQLGIYTRAYSLLLQPLTQIMAPLGKVVVPTLSKVGADDATRYRQAFLSITGKLSLITAPPVVFAIVNAHALVDLMLGDQWSEAAPIFAVLGLAGLTQPLGVATAWLFVTQGRTREMLLWSLVTFPFNIGAFFVGLPFGTLGVATAYSIYYVLQLPGLVWFVGRAGPVSASDMYRACVPAAVVSTAVGVVALAVRVAAHGSDRVAELAVSAPVAVVAAAAALALLPAGRRQVREALAAVVTSLQRRTPAQPG